jgi:hypothetical protein
LLSASDLLEVGDTVLAKILHVHLVVQAGSAAVEAASLDDGHIGHGLEIVEQARAAVGAEVMLVDLARQRDGVILLDSA